MRGVTGTNPLGRLVPKSPNRQGVLGISPLEGAGNGHKRINTVINVYSNAGAHGRMKLLLSLSEEGLAWNTLKSC